MFFLKGSNYFEIFNPSVKDPLSSFKLTGQHGIQKIFESELKGSVYQLDGIPTTTKISLPKEAKQGCMMISEIIFFLEKNIFLLKNVINQKVSLIQRIIVFQVNVKLNHEFSMEIGITDLSQNKRNLLFSTSHKELSVQPLSARIPIKSINRALVNKYLV